MEKKKKLQLKKETIVVLNGQKMNSVVGGVAAAENQACKDSPDCRADLECVDGRCIRFTTFIFGHCVKTQTQTCQFNCH